jgi:hypothetical protein
MRVTKDESRKRHRVLDTLNFQWVSNTGRFVLHVLSVGKVNFPKADLAGYRFELEKTKGFGRRLWLTVCHVAMDSVYFPVGLVFWVAVFFFGIYMFVTLVGPIPSIHEWR